MFNQNRPLRRELVLRRQICRGPPQIQRTTARRVSTFLDMASAHVASLGGRVNTIIRRRSRGPVDAQHRLQLRKWRCDAGQSPALHARFLGEASQAKQRIIPALGGKRTCPQRPIPVWSSPPSAATQPPPLNSSRAPSARHRFRHEYCPIRGNGRTKPSKSPRADRRSIASCAVAAVTSIRVM